MYSRIVTPLDGSDLAALALEHAKELARRYGVPIVLVRAVDPPVVNQVSDMGLRPTFGLNDPVYQEEDRLAKDYLDRMVGQLESQGIEASSLVVWGAAADAVASTLVATDLLVMSTHGRTGVKRWFVGSVAENILKRTTIPVMLVRQQDATE